MGLMKGPAFAVIEIDGTAFLDEQGFGRQRKVPCAIQFRPLQPVAELTGFAIGADACIGQFFLGLRGIHQTAERWRRNGVERSVAEFNVNPRKVLISPHADRLYLPGRLIAQLIGTPPLPSRPQAADEQQKNQQAGQVSVHVLI
jgi:hypothetical protein